MSYGLPYGHGETTHIEDVRNPALARRAWTVVGKSLERPIP